MAHFGGVVDSSLTGGFISGTTTDTGQTITGQSVDDSTKNSESFQSSLSIFNNILSGGELPETFRESIFAQNQRDLGQASLDISAALNEQIVIREDQRAETFGVINTLANFIGEINQRLSGQAVDLGAAVQDVSNTQAAGDGGGFFDGFSLPTFNDIKTPLIIAGLALGALIVIPRLIKGGFK